MQLSDLNVRHRPEDLLNGAAFLPFDLRQHHGENVPSQMRLQTLEQCCHLTSELRPQWPKKSTGRRVRPARPPLSAENNFRRPIQDSAG
jgi:hypothetical protein